jgi:hypothetical protein
MADESRTTQPGASIHENHYCCIPGSGKMGRAWFRQDQSRANDLVVRGALPALAEPRIVGAVLTG